MSTDFGKEVARHRQSSRFGECGSPKPPCHSTNLHHIWHDEITCLHMERLGHVVWSPPVFAQLNRRLCRAADVSMAYIVICQHWFFDPSKVLVIQGVDTPDSFWNLKGLIIVHHEQDIIANCTSDGMNHCHIRLEVWIAEPDLERLKTWCNQLLCFGGCTLLADDPKATAIVRRDRS